MLKTTDIKHLIKIKINFIALQNSIPVSIKQIIKANVYNTILHLQY
ncbi:hypothetical protein RG47T_1036 [Mucilaginibacter polytrichastri]|uniref:Uncharacterized protein n=1 Tax=Mucilaginibacter polytrichastri TaxID=1302689 RepID=A0A1Q5ZUZ8_9SPHI|nr:hypothetical protein RG47T_1036 [Mucilaginibacter polytrichastri]